MSEIYAQGTAYGLGQQEPVTLEAAEALFHKSVDDFLSAKGRYSDTSNPEVKAFRAHVMATLAGNLTNAAYAVQRVTYEAAKKK